MAEASRRSFLSLLGIAAITAASPLSIDEVRALAPPAIRKITPNTPLRDPIKLIGYYMDGRPCTIKMWDLGDHLVAWDSHENAFEAYTSRWEVNGEIFYTQTPKDLALLSGDVEQFRYAEDEAHLEACGVRPSSLRIIL